MYGNSVGHSPDQTHDPAESKTLVLDRNSRVPASPNIGNTAMCHRSSEARHPRLSQEKARRQRVFRAASLTTTSAVASLSFTEFGVLMGGLPSQVASGTCLDLYGGTRFFLRTCRRSAAIVTTRREINDPKAFHGIQVNLGHFVILFTPRSDATVHSVANYNTV